MHGLSPEEFAAYIGGLAMMMGFKLDTGETAIFARQLEFIRAQTYDIKYIPLKARMLIPIATDVDPGADSFTWRVFDWIGMAKLIANYADDLPLVDVFGTENNSPIRSIGAAYQYSIQDLRRSARQSAFGNPIPLDQRRARAARNTIERKIEDVAAFGEKSVGITGLVNNPNVPLFSPITGTWTTGSDPEDILNDLNAFVQSVVDTTSETERPDTLVLDVTAYGLIANLKLTSFPSMTVLKWFLANNPYITNVEQWAKLKTADAAGTGRRFITYRRDPEAVEMILPVEFETFPPQARNLAFVVDCHARIGGVVFHYPLSAAYMDGC